MREGIAGKWSDPEICNGYVDDLVTDRAVQWLDQKHEKPFFRDEKEAIEAALKLVVLPLKAAATFSSILHHPLVAILMAF